MRTFETRARLPAIAAALLTIAFAGGARAVSLSNTDAAQPMPADPRADMGVESLHAAETLTAGSGALVPLMAADVEASQTVAVDAPADTAGASVGKPVDDLSFVREATQAGRREVESARDALRELNAPDLKRIAAMLVTDHAGANAKLEKLAQTKGWRVPAPETAPAPPAGTASPDFDAKWTSDMIAAHEHAVALFRAQSQGGEDADLRRFARETLPTLEHHLAELRSLQK